MHIYIIIYLHICNVFNVCDMQRSGCFASSAQDTSFAVLFCNADDRIGSQNWKFPAPFSLLDPSPLDSKQPPMMFTVKFLFMRGRTMSEQQMEAQVSKIYRMKATSFLHYCLKAAQKFQMEFASTSKTKLTTHTPSIRKPMKRSYLIPSTLENANWFQMQLGLQIQRECN